MLLAGEMLITAEQLQQLLIDPTSGTTSGSVEGYDQAVAGER